MSLEIRCDLHQSAYLAGQAQTLYALVTFAPTGVLERLPLDLRIAIDDSGSMSSRASRDGKKSKTALLAEAVAAMIERLAPGDRLRLVAFDERARTLYDGAIQGPGDRKRAIQSLTKLGVGGGTRILAGLEGALADPPLEGSVARLVLVTDGEGLSEEEAACESLAFHQRGQTNWLVYGIGVDYNDRFLDGLAAANGGTYAHLADLEAASHTFEAAVAVMAEVALRNLVVEIQPEAGVGIARADRIVPQTLPVALQTPDYASVSLGDVDRVRGQKLLLQLSVDAMKPGAVPLARVRCSFHVPERKRLNQVREHTLAATFTLDASAIAPDDEVLRTARLAGAGRLYTLAMDELASGQAAAGGRTLASAAGLYDQLGLGQLGSAVKTLASAIAAGPGAGAGTGTEEVRRTLATRARAAWSEDAGDDVV